MFGVGIETGIDGGGVDRLRVSPGVGLLFSL